MYAVFLHGGDACPCRIAAYVRCEGLVYRNDHFRIPKQHLLDGNIGETAALSAGDVAREHFNRLDIDRPAEAGFQSARPTRVKNARALCRRNRTDPSRDRG